MTFIERKVNNFAKLLESNSVKMKSQLMLGKYENETKYWNLKHIVIILLFLSCVKQFGISVFFSIKRIATVWYKQFFSSKCVLFLERKQSTTLKTVNKKITARIMNLKRQGKIHVISSICTWLIALLQLNQHTIQADTAICSFKPEFGFYCTKFSSWLALFDGLNKSNKTDIYQMYLVPDEFLILTSRVLNTIHKYVDSGLFDLMICTFIDLRAWTSQEEAAAFTKSFLTVYPHLNWSGVCFNFSLTDNHRAILHVHRILFQKAHFNIQQFHVCGDRWERQGEIRLQAYLSLHFYQCKN
jgi:hypothetical protein